MWFSKQIFHPIWLIIPYPTSIFLPGNFHPIPLFLSAWLFDRLEYSILVTIHWLHCRCEAFIHHTILFTNKKTWKRYHVLIGYKFGSNHQWVEQPTLRCLLEEQSLSISSSGWKISEKYFSAGTPECGVPFEDDGLRGLFYQLCNYTGKIHSKLSMPRAPRHCIILD